MKISIDMKSKKNPPPKTSGNENYNNWSEKKITVGIQRQFEQEIISEPEDRTMEIIKYEEQKGKKKDWRKANRA